MLSFSDTWRVTAPRGDTWTRSARLGSASAHEVAPRERAPAEECAIAETAGSRWLLVPANGKSTRQ